MTDEGRVSLISFKLEKFVECYNFYNASALENDLHLFEED